MELRKRRSHRLGWLALATLFALALWPALAVAQDDAAAARTVVESLVAALNAGDADAAVELYADDAISMPPEQPANVGREAIAASMAEFLGQNEIVSETEIVEVEEHGDLAHVRATYHDTLTVKESGETSHVNGNWLLVLKRAEDGSWKISRELWAPVP